ncbi:MAG: bifunctional aspartate kinase/homoserine dehydrogenase I [Candidatus Alcyoniella australis]|nr:bifunctional aspartate kinase/homoserine dehydrogenase I [Candidatus Alcyoniella australis]
MLVHKFGGTSVKDAERISGVARLAVENRRPCVVVTSAMAGVTDSLIELARAAEAQDEAQVAGLLGALRDRHQLAAEALFADSTPEPRLTTQIDELLDELGKLIKGVALLRHLPRRSLDLILSFGERLSCELLAAAVEQSGAPSRACDARDFIRTDDHFGKANVDIQTSRELTRAALLDLSRDSIPVVTGFIGRTAQGLSTTLGRGGSDYTASLLGAFLDADRIWIWTDVDGVMTADPRVVPEAEVLPSISYREAAEMSYFGSKVLHPSTMIPAVQAKIPIRLRNSFRPELEGTLITDSRTDQFEGVKTVTSISDIAMVTVEGKGMIGVPGVVGRVFATTARESINVYMISQASSEQNISLLVHKRDGARAKTALDREFELELERDRIERVDLNEEVGILAIIGEGMKGTPGISQKLFTALGRSHINVLAIAQGSSELNVSVVVDRHDLHRAVGAVHTRFGLTSATHVFVLGKGLIGRTLLRQLVQSKARLRRHGTWLNVIGVCGRTELLFNEFGIDDQTLRRIADGESLLELGGEQRPDYREILKRVLQTRRLDVALVDVTAAETGELQLGAMRHGIHVVTANKKTLSGPLELYRSLRQTAREKGVGLYYETTFGAGLPVLFTLQDLLETHDTIQRITGCFSGTLGYICSGLQTGRRFSEVVREAKSLGYTEPDPRDDLCGMDVARKALIIAREMGQPLEMEQVALEGMVPDELLALPDVESFLARLDELDEPYAEKVRQAADQGRVLRYLAQITPEGVSVGLQAVELSSPEGQLSGPDNILVYQTDRYTGENPLVIRGPGAGAEVTAAGVFGDLLKVARHA